MNARIHDISLWGSFSAMCLLLLISTGHAHAKEVSQTAKLQDISSIKSHVEQFLIRETQGIPGEVNIQVGQIDRHMKLAPCASIEPFLPPGSRAWGKTTVGVRCASPVWTIYIQSKIQVTGEYLATAQPLKQGHVVSEQDLMFITGDLTALPPSIITEKNIAIGQTVATSMSAGAILRQDMLRKPTVVKQGQAVRIISSGKGFSVTAEGRALTNASDGQVVQAKTGNGTVISGVARAGGEVLVTF